MSMLQIKSPFITQLSLNAEKVLHHCRPSKEGRSDDDYGGYSQNKEDYLIILFYIKVEEHEPFSDV